MNLPSFDKSFLPPARCEFVVLADTHYMLDPGDRSLEFESRRMQSARAREAFQCAAALGADFCVHMGDLVQEYPESPRFVAALDEALQQIRKCGLEIHHAAGNHDVGDKPDPTMPTHPVDSRTLEQYHRRFGPSWYSFDRGDLHFAVLNSQIMNTGLSEERRQQAWLEEDLRNHAERRLFLFLHLPPFLCDPAEPHLGHYDNLGEPARTWLLDLIQRHRVELLFAGHVHFAFYDRIGATRIAVVPSPSFTRPGFGHLFTSPPPPEQGRDDREKLGFFFCRVRSDRTDLHLIRTQGRTRTDDATCLLTRLPSSLQGASLGITLLHPLASSTEVPLAWPSAIRQPVRNDYPFLACLEAGAVAVRAPWTDLERPLQRRRLSLLREEGVQVQVFLPWSDPLDLSRLLDAHSDKVDAWELQLPGTPWPSDACLDLLRTLHPRPLLSLAPILPGVSVPGKQHPRTRIGYSPDELAQLDRLLEEVDLQLDSALCRLDAEPWKTIRGLPVFRRIDRVDFLLTLPGEDDAQNALLAAEAIFAAALRPSSRIFVDPLVDLDRTMDVRHGLLDTLCNPRTCFHVLRCLNTLLHAFRGAVFASSAQETREHRLFRLASEKATLSLLLPLRGSCAVPSALSAPDLRLYRLSQGTVERPEVSSRLLADGPVLITTSR